MLPLLRSRLPAAGMLPAEQRRALLLVDKHSAGRESLLAAARKRIVALLGRADSRDFYTGEGQRRLAGDLAAIDRIAQTSFAGRTTAYLDAVARQVRQPEPTKVEPLPARPRGVDPVEVWLRPFEQFRYEYAKSQDEDRARKAMLNRADLILGDDLALGMRIATRNHAQAARTVIGQRRVIHPEVSKGGTCGLCLAASHQMYRPGDLQPLHQGCECTTAEVFRDADPGTLMNRDSLETVYAAAGGTGRQELQRVRFKIVPHSELGPTLAAA